MEKTPEIRPVKLVSQNNLEIKRDVKALQNTIQEIINKNSNQAEEYMNGKIKLKGFFIGQIMKATKGQADTQDINEILGRLLPQK